MLNHEELQENIEHLLAKEHDQKVLIDLLKDISGFFGSYFPELYEQTVAQREFKALAAG